MFEEYTCGCIVSRFQGRVRICPSHFLARQEGKDAWALTKVVARYPGNGEMPDAETRGGHVR